MRNRISPSGWASTLRLAINICLVWAFAITSFAQDDIDYGDYADQLEGAPKTYVPVYIIMIAFVGLALTLICRTSRRQADFRSTE